MKLKGTYFYNFLIFLNSFHSVNIGFRIKVDGSKLLEKINKCKNYNQIKVTPLKKNCVLCICKLYAKENLFIERILFLWIHGV